MEEEVEVSESSSNMIPIALAVLALVLGGAGLYFGLTANQRLTPLNATLEAGATGTAQLQKSIDQLEIEITELSAQLSDLQSSSKRNAAYANQRDQAIKKLASEINATREQIIKTAESLNELAASGVRRAAPAASASPSATPSADSPAEPTPPGVYVIESGDTFGKIATKTGVSLDALLAANPDAAPRRLSIGQQITIPGN